MKRMLLFIGALASILLVLLHPMLTSKVISSESNSNKPIIYALQFKGQVVPQNEQGTILTATTKSPSSSIKSVVSDNKGAGLTQPAHFPRRMVVHSLMILNAIITL